MSGKKLPQKMPQSFEKFTPRRWGKTRCEREKGNRRATPYTPPRGIRRNGKGMDGGCKI